MAEEINLEKYNFRNFRSWVILTLVGSRSHQHARSPARLTMCL